MAVSVIDTRGEFKFVPYSGDDEHWPQWALKLEAWSELVRWDDNWMQQQRQLCQS